MELIQFTVNSILPSNRSPMHEHLDHVCAAYLKLCIHNLTYQTLFTGRYLSNITIFILLQTLYLFVLYQGEEPPFHLTATMPRMTLDPCVFGIAAHNLRNTVLIVERAHGTNLFSFLKLIEPHDSKVSEYSLLQYNYVSNF